MKHTVTKFEISVLANQYFLHKINHREMEPTNEIITISVGQAGARISSACWDLICLEHAIEHDRTQQPFVPLKNMLTFFVSSKEQSTAEGKKNKFTPHAVMVDLEPRVIDEIRTGIYRDRFDPACLITGNEDAGNNFARGYYTTNRRVVDDTLDRIRTICEKCNALDGFLIFRSLGGGTGSGFTSLLLEHLENDYKKMLKIDFAIYPADITSMTVEPYNSIFSIHNSKDYNVYYFMMDNEALYNICRRQLGVNHPKYRNLNRLQAQVVAYLTTHTRFTENAEQLQIIYNNVISCSKNFFLTASAPFINPASPIENLSIDQITNACLYNSANQMVKCHLANEFHTNCCFFYRGNVIADEVARATRPLTQVFGICPGNIPFIDKRYNIWPPITIPGSDFGTPDKSLATVSVTSVVEKVLNNLAEKFRLMYQHRTFVHHYLAEGMEENTFQTAETKMQAICNDYKQLRKVE